MSVAIYSTMRMSLPLDPLSPSRYYRLASSLTEDSLAYVEDPSGVIGYEGLKHHCMSD